jgi:hypothetical protein
VAHLSAISIGKRARILAAARTIGAASPSLSAGQAEAGRNDHGVLCGIEQADGHIDFYMPGYSWHCGEDPDHVQLRRDIATANRFVSGCSPGRPIQARTAQLGSSSFSSTVQATDSCSAWISIGWISLDGARSMTAIIAINPNRWYMVEGGWQSP